jgi:hypothetical protein
MSQDDSKAASLTTKLATLLGGAKTWSGGKFSDKSSSGWKLVTS